MNIIVAVDEGWGIGCGGRLLTSIPEDMKYFRQVTEGKTVVMGHSTLKSLPGSKPLANRTNIVLSRNTCLTVEGATVLSDVKELLKLVQNKDDVFVIGGQQIYKLLLPYCTDAFITKIFARFPADTFFPDIDKLQNWNVVWNSEVKTHGEIDYMFLRYKNSFPERH